MISKVFVFFLASVQDVLLLAVQVVRSSLAFVYIRQYLGINTDSENCAGSVGLVIESALTMMGTVMKRMKIMLA